MTWIRWWGWTQHECTIVVYLLTQFVHVHAIIPCFFYANMCMASKLSPVSHKGYKAKYAMMKFILFWPILAAVSLQKTCIYCGFTCHIRCKKCTNPACGKDFQFQQLSPSKLYRRNPSNTWKLLRNKVCTHPEHEHAHTHTYTHTHHTPGMHRYVYILIMTSFFCRHEFYTILPIWMFLSWHTSTTPFETAPVCLQLMD